MSTRPRPHLLSLAGGFVLGCALTVAAFELPYVNWQDVAAPIESTPLLIRRDAKGDGRFLAPRSGHRRHRGIDLVAELNSPVRAIPGPGARTRSPRVCGSTGSPFCKTSRCTCGVTHRLRALPVFPTVPITVPCRTRWPGATSTSFRCA